MPFWRAAGFGDDCTAEGDVGAAAAAARLSPTVVFAASVSTVDPVVELLPADGFVWEFVAALLTTCERTPASDAGAVVSESFDDVCPLDWVACGRLFFVELEVVASNSTTPAGGADAFALVSVAGALPVTDAGTAAPV